MLRARKPLIFTFEKRGLKVSSRCTGLTEIFGEEMLRQFEATDLTMTMCTEE